MPGMFYLAQHQTTELADWNILEYSANLYVEALLQIILFTQKW